MEKYFAIISELKLIRHQQKLLAKREKEVAAPRLTNLDLIPEIYRYFCQLCPHEGERRQSVRQRKLFIFVILMLYSPAAMVGGKMPHGLRERLGDALNITARSTISNNHSDLSFLYQTYNDFREEADNLYFEVEKHLISTGLIIE